MKVVLTGSEGFIGRHLATEIELEHQLIKVDIKENKEGKENHVIMDVTDYSQVKVLEEVKPEAIIHAAAIAKVSKCQEEPRRCYEINVNSTLNLLELSRKVDLNRFIYISSGGVYSPKQGEKDVINEDFPIEPKGVYALTKHSSELLIKEYSNSYGLKAIIMRITAPYGPGMWDREAISRHALLFAEKVVKEEDIVMSYGGDHTINYTYVKDIAYAVTLALISRVKGFEIFNISGGRNYRISELGEVCKDINPKLNVSIGKGYLLNSYSEEELLKPINVVQGLWDIRKAKELLHYEPRYTLKRGMKELVESLNV
jgi:nucleoside-diphosphate-sugar epimerase